ncbi:MAG TPA: sensor histidine kinase [Crenalkalicoccus sp.]|nr:sensor histidine kinase [Crenalkalicoccus sp.]
MLQPAADAQERRIGMPGFASLFRKPLWQISATPRTPGRTHDPVQFVGTADDCPGKWQPRLLALCGVIATSCRSPATPNGRIGSQTPLGSDRSASLVAWRIIAAHERPRSGQSSIRVRHRLRTPPAAAPGVKAVRQDPGQRREKHRMPTSLAVSHPGQSSSHVPRWDDDARCTVAEILGGMIVVYPEEPGHRTDALDRREALLAQRETLLLEGEHRLKNSLQLISSVLELQARDIADPALREGFLQASRRVRILARIHERLHGLRQAGKVDLAVYLRKLCVDLVESLALSEEQPIEVETADAAVPADQAVRLGLILNELIINAMKHGQRGGSSARVRVRLSRHAEGAMRLSVADQGDGLPEGFDPSKSGGLGMRLVQGLVHTLGARLETECGGRGARFTVLLPAASPQGRGGVAPGRAGGDAPCA